ncbi:hypothetical protein JTB14_011079 [Gonioctena quinquepunctata]|nr:hypothetical protein JTB14_011079 [Gonioctena quinquepunctata]
MKAIYGAQSAAYTGTEYVLARNPSTIRERRETHIHAKNAYLPNRIRRTLKLCFNAIMSELSVISNTVNLCQSQIETLNGLVAVQSQSISECCTEIASLRRENDELRTRMTALKANSSSESFENIQAELTERSRREKNVLIFGVPESNTTEDSKQVKNTLDAIDPKINEKLISIFCLSKLRADGKPPPIKLNFHSAVDALYTET